jgi:signal transduction histidine kinase
LISNAIKYSSPNKNISINLFNNYDNVRFKIQDEGPGLSDADQQKLFSQFTRLTPQPTGGEHSTGLGLFIVKQLVEAMQGRVWCESMLGHGATFIVEFPRVN